MSCDKSFRLTLVFQQNKKLIPKGQTAMYNCVKLFSYWPIIIMQLIARVYNIKLFYDNEACSRLQYKHRARSIAYVGIVGLSFWFTINGLVSS